MYSGYSPSSKITFIMTTQQITEIVRKPLTKYIVHTKEVSVMSWSSMNLFLSKLYTL